MAKVSLVNSAKELALFFKEGLLRFHDTGTVCATSHWAARALTNPLRQMRAPQRILEVGPGTGSVTIKILQDMIPGDSLTVCEINPRFMEALKKRLATNPDYIALEDDVSFFEGPVQGLPEDGLPYDVIVCALPFSNFSITTVQEIFEKLHSMSHDETVMTYYEYIGLRKMGQLVSTPERRNRLTELDKFFDEKHERELIMHKRVWLNFLPIHVHTLRFGTN